MEKILFKTARFVWESRHPDPPPGEDSAWTLGVNPILLQILRNRGLKSEAEARAFLFPEVSHLHPAWSMDGMAGAVERILEARRRSETILVHGDFDADGITGAAILIKVLERLSCKVLNHIPDRFSEDYGISIEGVKKRLALGAGLMITVDCGSNSADEIEFARKSGMDVIITDHHRPLAPSSFPPVTAFLNPKKEGSTYPDRDISGSGVALKLAMGIVEKAGLNIPVDSLLKMACIGTIADIVPLTGENRVIVKLGLKGLQTPKNPGLKAILEVSDLSGGVRTAQDVGFRIAPRLNAAGRMTHAGSALELFLTSSDAEAAAISRKLDAENKLRQAEQERILDEALRTIDRDEYGDKGRVLIVAGEGWHKGVIGIVAAKLKEKFCRPAIVISIEGEEGRGSARSIRGYDITEALHGCRDLLIRYGGHAMAAGLTIHRESIETFREQMHRAAKQVLAEADLIPRLWIDAELRAEDLDVALVEELELLAPHGPGNPKPCFLLPSVAVVGQAQVLKEKHLRFNVGPDRSGPPLKAIFFDGAARRDELRASGGRIHVACEPKLNIFRGTASVELLVRDFVSAGG
jgi:single-stranded-DNA-specific exonuclease